ncbi:Uma2 family endonuclease [Kitasatospora sp. NPDC007106]|uniref:Uma2 family endonuclease n=1 Tax=Kitasatospora sp. NPDC007106 TaxID=3156914 RepID=UPI0033E07F58
MTIRWTVPPSKGWTYQQLADVDLDFDWELVDGAVLPRGLTALWHDQVRDSLAEPVRRAAPWPYRAIVRTAVLIDERNLLRPDVVVYDRTGVDSASTEHLSPGDIALVVEVVSPTSRSDDRFRRPGQYAEAGIPSYWRVERSDDGLPVVHEFRLDEEQGVYLPVAVHEGLLVTAVPFPVEIDLKQVVEL